MRVEFPTAPHAVPWKTLAAQFITYLTQSSVQPNGATSIGRIIARAPDKMRHTPVCLDRIGKPKPTRHSRKPRKPKGLKTAPIHLWAVDTVERVREGMRRYVLTLIEPVSAIAFAVAPPSKHARHSAAAAQALIEGLGGTTEHQILFLSDNGSEFKGAPDEHPHPPPSLRLALPGKLAPPTPPRVPKALD